MILCLRQRRRRHKHARHTKISPIRDSALSRAAGIAAAAAATAAADKVLGIPPPGNADIEDVLSRSKAAVEAAMAGGPSDAKRSNSASTSSVKGRRRRRGRETTPRARADGGGRRTNADSASSMNVSAASVGMGGGGGGGGGGGSGGSGSARSAGRPRSCTPTEFKWGGVRAAGGASSASDAELVHSEIEDNGYEVASVLLAGLPRGPPDVLGCCMCCVLLHGWRRSDVGETRVLGGGDAAAGVRRHGHAGMRSVVSARVWVASAVRE